MPQIERAYELLIRWSADGAIAGAHIQRRVLTTDDAGAVLADTLLPAQALTVETAEGFPLGDLLTQAQIDALTAKATADAERDAALADKVAAEASRDTAMARAAELEAQLAALQPLAAQPVATE